MAFDARLKENLQERGNGTGIMAGEIIVLTV
jgi:hypothetical protein